jgi:hypothetical protein
MIIVPPSHDWVVALPTCWRCRAPTLHGSHRERPIRAARDATIAAAATLCVGCPNTAMATPAPAVVTAVSSGGRDTGLPWDPREGSPRALRAGEGHARCRGPAYEPSPQVKPVSR